MTGLDEALKEDAGVSPSSTPTVRGALRRWAFWAVCAAGAVVVALVVLVVNGGEGSSATLLDGESPTPTGSKALVEVLGDEGVDVAVASSYEDAASELEADGGTLMLYDPSGYLDAEQLAALTEDASRVVLVQPGFQALSALADGVYAGGSGGGEVAEADCDDPDAAAAETLVVESTFTLDDGAGTGCFPVDDTRFGMVRIDDGAHELVLLGSSSALTNEGIVEEGHAALALRLLGSTDRLVWYLPTIGDVPGGQTLPTIGELTPRWVVPVTTLLALTTIAAMFWRGRRFGPVVVEDMPVVVRSGETVEGRARLYARTGARLRAADALRMGAADRIARLLGLARTTLAYEVADAAAAAAGIHRSVARRILVDDIPQTDAQLIALSDALVDLERRVRIATDETGRMTR